MDKNRKSPSFGLRETGHITLLGAAVIGMSLLGAGAQAQAPGWQAPSINNRTSSGPRYWTPGYQYQPAQPQYGNSGHPLFYNPGVLVPPGVDINNLDYDDKPDPDRSRRLTAQGVDLIQKGQFKEAEQTFFAAYCNDPHNSYAINDIGVALDRQQDIHHAMGYYTIAFKTDPKNAWAYYNYGYDSVTVIGSSAAIPYFYQALKLEPNHPIWWYWCANNLVATGQDKYALYCYGKAIQYNPKYADAYHWKGYVELRDHDDADAHPDLQKAIALNPSLAPTITAAVKSIMAARKRAEEEREAEARADKEALKEAARMRAYYQKHGHEIQSVVAQGPSYYKEVYVEARNQGESPDEAAQKEQAARDNYNRDVALQNAYDANDMDTYNKILAGDMGTSEIANYDSSSSPTAAGNSDDGYSSESSNNGGSSEESAPEPEQEQEPEQESDSSGGD